VDAFIRATLAERGIAPAAEADRRTLARRAYFDLTGLPPTPGEVDSFEQDTDPEAFRKLVDRLLESPRYGEHWARHWLDVASYADTHGNDHDFERPNAWPYRDYVIRSFNADKPYRRFVQEQVAGDALFPADPDATLALGFLAAGPWDHTLMVTVRADTVDHRMSQNLDRDAMVSAAIGTFQSVTIHCARCHDHKFDPITQREYYSLQAVFAGVDRADRPYDPDPALHALRTRLRAERYALTQREPRTIARLESPEVKARVEAWEKAWQERESAWQTFDVRSLVSTGGASMERQPDGSWYVTGTRPERDTYIVTARCGPGRIAAVRLEAMPDDRLPHHGPGRWDNGNFHLSEFHAFVATNGTASGATPLVVGRATADYDEGPTVSAAQAIDGKASTSWGVHPRYGERHEAIFELKTPLDLDTEALVTVTLEFQDGVTGHGLGRFRLSACREVPASGVLRPVGPEVTAILGTPASTRSGAQRRELALAVLLAENQRAIEQLPASKMVYAVTHDFLPDGENFKPAAGPRPIHVLTRGDLARPKEQVGPGAMGCVPGMSSGLAVTDLEDESQRRAALALWLTDDRNVLTWRSIVNRVWAQHFGRGLCDTPNDLGRMGGVPSHPELLDWLAVWFRDEAHGSIKALHRLILTSAAWRQSSLGGQGMAADPENRLLWRQNRTRLAGEEVRDGILAIAGRLDLTMGGKPAVQFLSKGDATFNPGGAPAFLDYEHFDPDAPESRRRSIYRFVFRTVPDPFMDALDCPDGGAVAAVRNVSTTPVQALAMLNDGFVIRQSANAAARFATAGRSPEEQVTAMFRSVLLRSPSDPERSRVAEYVRRHGLAGACQLLFNSNEFLYID
jgi:hypothetical protein